jgi:hypothetical protein
VRVVTGTKESTRTVPSRPLSGDPGRDPRDTAIATSESPDASSPRAALNAVSEGL